MAVLSGKDIYSSKYITADITDSSNRVFYIPIKYVLGDYFLAMIENQLYCFKLEGQRIYTYRHTLSKSFRKVYYNTEHYLPLSPGDVKNLEEILKVNGLPNVDEGLRKTFKILAKKETKEFKEHDLAALIEEIGQEEKEYPEEVANMKKYLEQLGTKKIVTPIKKLSEFLDIEIALTDPRFMGSVVNAVVTVEDQHKRMTNTVNKNKKPLAKIILLILVVICAGVGIWYLSTSGVLSHGVPGVNFGGSTPASANDIMKQYPDPAQLKQAVNEGKVKYEDLPPDVQKMLDQVRLPVTPIPAQH